MKFAVLLASASLLAGCLTLGPDSADVEKALDSAPEMSSSTTSQHASVGSTSVLTRRFEAGSFSNVFSATINAPGSILIGVEFAEERNSGAVSDWGVVLAVWSSNESAGVAFSEGMAHYHDNAHVGTGSQTVRCCGELLRPAASRYAEIQGDKRGAYALTNYAANLAAGDVVNVALMVVNASGGSSLRIVSTSPADLSWDDAYASARMSTLPAMGDRNVTYAYITPTTQFVRAPSVHRTLFDDGSVVAFLIVVPMTERGVWEVSSYRTRISGKLENVSFIFAAGSHVSAELEYTREKEHAHPNLFAVWCKVPPHLKLVERLGNVAT